MMKVNIKKVHVNRTRCQHSAMSYGCKNLTEILISNLGMGTLVHILLMRILRLVEMCPKSRC